MTASKNPISGQVSRAFLRATLVNSLSTWTETCPPWASSVSATSALSASSESR